MSSKNISNNDHAFLSPSKFHWIRYDKEKLIKAYYNWRNVQNGTKLHALAETLILARHEQKRDGTTFNTYVNDAIKYKMEPEKLLWYSENLFGHADALMFKPPIGSRKGILRIHDLKTGIIPAHFDQLIIYAAIYCVTNNVDTDSIDIELRIYQNDDVQIYEPTCEEMNEYISSMVEADNIVNELRMQEGGYVY